jgi:hypothetical protein
MSINQLGPWGLWQSAVNCAWDSSCSCCSSGCSAEWEVVERDTILPTSIHGAEVPGGAADIEAFHPEASPRVEAEAFQDLACVAEAEVVVPAARINSGSPGIGGKKLKHKGGKGVDLWAFSLRDLTCTAANAVRRKCCVLRV